MKNKKFLFISLLILAIGFAAVSTTLYISGNLVFGTNKNDFDIYFNKAILDDVDVYEDVISEDKRTITFTTKNLKTIGDKSILEYQVMNNSRGYDAKVEVNCNLSDNKYVSYTNTLNDTILAQTVEDGILTLTLDKVSTEEVEETITCSLVYKATERTSKAELYDENTYVLSGYLEDEEGNALANQNIVVYSETPHITSTNSLGYFYVENLLNEKHEIYITNKQTSELENMTKEEVTESSISKGTFKVTNDTITLDNSYSLKNEKIVISSNFDKTCADLVGTVYNYDYTGGEQIFETPCSGKYKIELWGASGGNGNGIQNKSGGQGAYVSGFINTNINYKFYINIGGKGSDAPKGTYGEKYNDIKGGYNGGASTTGLGQCWGAGGGGATHLALESGLLKDISIENVLLVAAGGGGSSIEKNRTYIWEGNGGAAGGLNGYPGTTEGNTQCIANIGASQISGGSSTCKYFGYFGYSQNGYDGGGGGGGYYGGGSGVCSGGSGGSSYINGHDGCSSRNTLYKFYDTLMIDGAGYNWTTARGSYVGQIQPDGTTTTGHSGNGYARITLIYID